MMTPEQYRAAVDLDARERATIAERDERLSQWRAIEDRRDPGAAAARRADEQLRIAWLRVKADELFARDDGDVAAAMLDLSDLLVLEDERGADV